MKKFVLIFLFMIALMPVSLMANETTWLDANTDDLSNASSIIVYVLTLFLGVIGAIIASKYFFWTLSWVDAIFMSGEDVWFGKVGAAITGFCFWCYFGFHALSYWVVGIEGYVLDLFA